MKHEDFLKELRENPEYVEVEEELKPILDIANDVLRLRLEKGWSQSELARRTGTRQANISKLENGLGNPTLAFLRKVARALETDLNVRIGAEQRPEPTRVIVRQEVPSVQPETLWGGKQSQQRPAARWAGFVLEAKPSGETDRYEAA